MLERRPGSRTRRLSRVATLVVVVLVGGVIVPAGSAGAEPACAVTRQLTTSPGPIVRDVTISADGRHLAYVSEDNPLGTNADGNEEIFLLDLLTGDLTQVTTTAGGGTFGPDLSADGAALAFASNRNLVGTNADLTYEVFLYAAGTEDITQITDSAGQSYDPSLSADGTLIAYASDAGGNAEIYLYDTVTDDTTPVTPTASGDSYGPALSGAGDVVAFESTADLTGDNADGSSEIFVHDVDEDETTQISDAAAAAGDSTSAALSADGTVVAFQSFADLVGTNAEGNLEIYRYEIAAEDLEQVTVTTVGTNGGPKLSGDGSRTAFSATSDLLGPTPNSEIYVHETPGDTITPLTDTPGAITSGTDISGDGTQIVVRTRGNLLGGNPDGQWDLYLAACGSAAQSFTDVPPSHLFFDEIEWMAAAGVSNGYPDGTYRPGATVSRAAMSAFMHRLAGSPEVDDSAPQSFSDVAPSHPFYEAIQWMDAAGISNGYPDGTYRPGQPVLRGAMSAFLYRLAGSPEVDDSAPQAFSDVSSSHLFYEAIQWMDAEEVSTGYPDGTYRPAPPVLRGAMSAFLYRLAAGPGTDLSP